MRINASFDSPIGLRLLSLILAAIPSALAVVGCGPPAATESDRQDKALETIRADVVALTLSPWPKVVRSQGSLYADEESVVGSKVAGRVAQVHVDLGDFVKTGDPLVSLDREEFELQVAQAEAQLQQTRSAVGLRQGDPLDELIPEHAPPVREQKAMWEEAKSVLERAAKLRDQDAIAEGEYDQAAAAERVAEARYSSAINTVREKLALIGVRQAELSLAHQRLRDAVIEAPLDGFVQQRHVAVGTYLSVGQPIAVVVRDHPLRFRGTVPERHAQSLTVGQEVRLQIESVSHPLRAEISRISPTLDQQSRALMFEAEIDNSDHQLRTGLFAEAEVVVDSSAQSLVIPESAIIEFAGTQKVWKIVDDVAGEQEVLIGERRDGAGEVLEGLSLGDTIMLDAAMGRVARIEPISRMKAARKDESSEVDLPLDQQRAGNHPTSTDPRGSESS